MKKFLMLISAMIFVLGQSNFANAEEVLAFSDENAQAYRHKEVYIETSGIKFSSNVIYQDLPDWSFARVVSQPGIDVPIITFFKDKDGKLHRKEGFIVYFKNKSGIWFYNENTSAALIYDDNGKPYYRSNIHGGWFITKFARAYTVVAKQVFDKAREYFDFDSVKSAEVRVIEKDNIGILLEYGGI